MIPVAWVKSNCEDASSPKDYESKSKLDCITEGKSFNFGEIAVVVDEKPQKGDLFRA